MSEDELIRTVQRRIMPIPAEIPKYRIDDFVRIQMVGKTFMARILQAEMIAPIKMWATEYGGSTTIASKLTGVNDQEVSWNAGDFNEFYKPAENTIEDFVIALESDIPIEVETYYPGSAQLFGINKAQKLRWNQDISEKFNPTIRLPVLANQKPNHTFVNLARAAALTPLLVALWHAGTRYVYEPLTALKDRRGTYVSECGDELEVKTFARLNIVPVISGGC